MSIEYHKDWGVSEKGRKDAERHRKKIDKAIRDKVGDVISEESIITKKKGKKVRIPVRGLKDYRFIYGRNKGGAGVGQGPGKPGDIIGKKPKGGGDQQGPPGDQEGEDYMETEVDIDYLIEIMFEELGLPWIEEKTKKEELIPKGWKFETISKKGILPRVHKKRTMIEAIKRNVMFAAAVMEETGCNEESAYRALNQASGDLKTAITIIKTGTLSDEISESPTIFDEDLRYKQIERDVEYHSKAVVIAMMDVSYSMHQKKKYLARSMLFWLTQFLKKVYDFVEIRFITHTTTAKVVSEDEFFHKRESGGTRCASAFELANYMIDTEYPTQEWNVYGVYLSDGEDFSPAETVREIGNMLKRKINMLGYVEILVEYDESTGYYGSTEWRTLLREIRKKYHFTEIKKHGTEFYENKKERFLLAVIKDKSHVYPTLKHLLFEKRK